MRAITKTLLFGGLMTMTGCSQNDSVTSGTVDEEYHPDIIVKLPESGETKQTRVVFGNFTDEATSAYGLMPYWTEGDQVGLFNTIATQNWRGWYQATANGDNTGARFTWSSGSGLGTPATGGQTLMGVYPSERFMGSNKDYQDGAISLLAMKQVGNDNTDHLGKNLLMYGFGRYETKDVLPEIDMEYLVSMAKVTCNIFDKDGTTPVDIVPLGVCFEKVDADGKSLQFLDKMQLTTWADKIYPTDPADIQPVYSSSGTVAASRCVVSLSGISSTNQVVVNSVFFPQDFADENTRMRITLYAADGREYKSPDFYGINFIAGERTEFAIPLSYTGSGWVLKSGGKKLAVTGLGTAESPIEIPDLTTLVALRDKLKGNNRPMYGMHFKLTNDIDLSSIENWIPIGYSKGVPFMGHFDGDGHKITGMKIDETQLSGSGGRAIGFFGYVAGGSIKDLTVEGAIKLSTLDDGAWGFNVGGVVGECAASLSGNITSQVAIHCATDYACAWNIGGVIGAIPVAIENSEMTLNYVQPENQPIYVTSSAKTLAVGAIVGVYSLPFAETANMSFTSTVENGSGRAEVICVNTRTSGLTRFGVSDVVGWKNNAYATNLMTKVIIPEGEDPYGTNLKIYHDQEATIKNLAKNGKLYNDVNNPFTIDGTSTDAPVVAVPF